MLAGHGLQISTATIVQRYGSHLSLTLHYNPLKLLQAENNMPRMAVLSNMSEEAYAKEYATIQQFFQKHLDIKIGERALFSPHFRFNPPEKFKKALRGAFMEAMTLQQSGHGHSHPPMLYVKLDGFLPKDANSSRLLVHFPKEIGEVMVSFSRPVIQTLQPDSNGSVFSLTLPSN